MDQLIAALLSALNASDPIAYKVKSVTGPDGVTTQYQTYQELLLAYQLAQQVNSQDTVGAYRPIRLGRGDRGGMR